MKRKVYQKKSKLERKLQRFLNDVRRFEKASIIAALVLFLVVYYNFFFGR